MENQIEITPYVWDLIKRYSKELNVDFDIRNPTKESRLELALAMDNAGVDTIFCAEIMVGRRITCQPKDDNIGRALLKYQMFKAGNPNNSSVVQESKRVFYDTQL